MGETSEFYNVPIMDNSMEQSVGKVVVDSVESQVSAEPEVTTAPEEEVKIPESVNKEVGDMNEEHVESPSTGEAYIFKCIFCDQVLSPTDSPKLLECLHNACGNCIQQKIFENHDSGVERNDVECPQCNIPCEATKIIDNHFLLELSNNEESKLAELKCSSCSDDAIATSWCMDCSEYICDNCVQAHQRLKITKDHTIKPKEEGLNDHQSTSSSTTTNLFCMIHPHEKLSLFCETCDKLTCRDCQLIEHREHKYKFTNEIAVEARKFIADMLKDVGYKRTLLNSAMKVIDDRQNLIVEKKQALVKEVTQLVVKLTNTINVRGKQLVAKLTEVCDGKQKTLQEKKQALEQLSKMTDHCIEFTQNALDNGSDMALLYSKKQMTDHLKKIKCKRADIPNPEIPVRIHLALDKFPELVKVMSTIGQIVVDGRIYPSQSASPSPNSLPPHGSPSPSQNRPPQEQSPINSPIPPQTSFSSPQPPQQTFPQTRLPPPYGQYSPYQQVNQVNASNLSAALGHQKMGHQHPGNSMQHMQNTFSRMPMPPRSSIQRPLMPRFPPNSGGMNQQQQQLIADFNYQQVSSSTHPQAMLQDRSNLRGLLQHNNNPVYVQTGPSQYQAIQPHLAHQFQNRYPSQQQPHPMQSPQQSQLQQQQQQQQQQQHHSVQQQQPQSAQQQQQQHPPPPQQQQQQPPQHPPTPQQLQQFRQQNSLRMIVPTQQQISRGVQRHLNTFSGGAARWHIPQQTTNNVPNSNTRNMTLPTINDNFKITLKPQNPPTENKNLPATVTSTIPKTPSPNHIQGRSDTERNLDKYCEDSVKDLIATIAKLDSNGVQVVAEGRQKTGGSPHVDSSTGDAGPSGKIKSDPLESSGKDDPNEDWCAVCMDGGELVCCDKCPKVFHQYCHIPNLSVEENDTWQCLLCTNFADFPDHLLHERKEGELGYRERKIAERIVLELYCQYDPSLPFREVIGPENENYHAIIKNPIALDTIRQRLNWEAPDHYRSMEQLIKDIRLMFRNAYTYNPEDSQIYMDAKHLEKFFDEQLEKFLPEYAYETFDDDIDIQPPNKKFRRIIND